MTAKDLEDTLAAIANKAKALREAGVRGAVSIGDVHFVLADDVPPIDAAAGGPILATLQEERFAPIDDPDTYGGVIPTRRKPKMFSDNDEE